MQKSYKQMIQDKQVTEKLLLSSLVACEEIIRENAYLEKQWKEYSDFSNYKETRLEWSDYRTKLREALQRKYEMKKIIAMSKTHTDKVAQRTVKAVVELIDTGDFVLL